MGSVNSVIGEWNMNCWECGEPMTGVKTVMIDGIDNHQMNITCHECSTDWKVNYEIIVRSVSRTYKGRCNMCGGDMYQAQNCRGRLFSHTYVTRGSRLHRAGRHNWCNPNGCEAIDWADYHGIREVREWHQGRHYQLRENSE